MTTTILGKVGINPRGAWSASVADYERLDELTYAGSTYRVILKNGKVPAGTLPTNEDYFEVSAEKGGKGDKGDLGPQGNPGEGLEENQYENYILPVLDALSRLLGGWRKDGSFEITKWLAKNIPASALKDGGIDVTKLHQSLIDHFAKATDLVPFNSTKSYVDTALQPVFVEDPSGGKYLLPVVDAFNRLLSGYEKDGSWFASKYKAKSIDAAAIKDESLGLDKLSTETKTGLWTPLNPETGYICAILDQKNRILIGIKTDGKVVAKFDYPILPDLSITLQKLSAELQGTILSGGISNLIIFIGDSLTAGAGGGGVTIATVFQELVGAKYQCVNLGVGGENAPTIAARQGGVPAVIIQGFELPADLTPVQISSVPDNKFKNTVYNSNINWLKQGGSSMINPCFVQGIECTISWNGTSSSDPNGVWNIRRNVAGPAKTIAANSPIITASAKKYRKPFIISIEIGQNGWNTGNVPSELVDYYKRMIEYSGCENYLCIGMHTGTPASRAAVEKAMADAFGLRYINIREYFSTYALADMGMIPTEADLTAMAAGTFPPSFWLSETDSTHGNPAFYTAKGRLAYNRAVQLGYINN